VSILNIRAIFHKASELESRPKEFFTIIICLVVVATVAFSTAGITGAKALQNADQLQTEIEKREEVLHDVYND